MTQTLLRRANPHLALDQGSWSDYTVSSPTGKAGVMIGDEVCCGTWIDGLEVRARRWIRERALRDEELNITSENP